MYTHICTLQHLGSELVNFFSNPIHLSLYNDTLNKLIAHDEIKTRADVDESTPLIVKQPSTEQPPPRKRSTLTRVTAIDSPTTVRNVMNIRLNTCIHKYILTYI